MDPQAVITAATIANATTMGTAEASKAFLASLKSELKVNEKVKADDQAYITKHCNFRLMFTQLHAVTGDHVVIVAFRNLARQVFENLYGLVEAQEPTLLIGCSDREISLYSHNLNLHFHVFGKENKDYDRIIRPALLKISKFLDKKLAKNDKRVRHEESDTGSRKPLLKRYQDHTEIMNDYLISQKLPAVFHDDSIFHGKLDEISQHFNTLVFQDSLYNITEEQLCRMFLKTGASIGFGYGFYPNELVFGWGANFPSNPIYRYWEHQDSKTGKTRSCVTWHGGYQNGYEHDKETWAMPLQKIAISAHGISIAIEINVRIGPMMVFKLIRVQHHETLVREISLTEAEAYVLVLDLYASVDHKSCTMRNPLKYFAMREGEFYEGYNYTIGLPEASKVLANVIAYIRRRYGGASLAFKEAAPKWDLNRRDLHKASIGIFLAAAVMSKKTDKAIQLSNPTSTVAKFQRVIWNFWNCIALPLMELVNWLFEENLTDKIVLNPDHSCVLFQRAEVFKSRVLPTITLDLLTTYEEDEPKNNCPICAIVCTPDNHQKYKCEYEPDPNKSMHTFKLTDTEVQKFINDMRDDDLVPIGLKNLMEKVKNVVSPLGFSYTCRVEYICGGPGTGKSDMIRRMADPEKDLILAPFSKLMTDYTGVVKPGKQEMEEEKKQDWLFKTQHRGILETGHEVIYVDEFTRFPYEMLAITAQRNQPHVIYLVGDTKQTKVWEGQHGMYIGNYVDVEKLSRHTLRVNFRNPIDTVALLNRNFGYEMIPFSKVSDSIEIISPAMVADKIKGKRSKAMAFTNRSALANVDDEKATVTSNQGGSTPVSVVYITQDDYPRMAEQDQQIVSLSRHTEKCYLVTDGSSRSATFINDLRYSEDFKTHIQEFISFPLEPVKLTEFKADPIAEFIINPKSEHPTMDAYREVLKLVPAVAVLPEVHSLNWEESQVVTKQFATATTNLCDVFSPVNARGHPVKMGETFYAVGAGMGLHFSPTVLMQEWNVVAVRYDKIRSIHKDVPEEAKALIADMVQHYFLTYKSKALENCGFKGIGKPSIVETFLDDEQRISSMADKFVHDASVRHYDKRYTGVGGLDSFGIDDVRFAVKSIFKPVNTNKDFDLSKAAQGLNMFDPWIVNFFCFACRVLRQIDLSSDNTDGDHVVLSNDGLSEFETMQAVVERMATHGNVPLEILIADGVEYDATFDYFTLHLEEEYYRGLGCSEVFLAFYHRMRVKYRIIAKTINCVPKAQHATGEPNTIEANEVPIGVISTYVATVVGPSTAVKQGDDRNRIGMKFTIDQKLLNKIESYTNMRIKFQIKRQGEFCGMILTSDGMYPNIYRRLVKISGCQWRSYEHFCEYQKSLRDYKTLIEKLGVSKVIAVSAVQQNASYSEMSHVWECIDSWGHINKEQWEEIVQKFVLPVLLPVRENDRIVLREVEFNAFKEKVNLFSYALGMISKLKKKSNSTVVRK